MLSDKEKSKIFRASIRSNIWETNTDQMVFLSNIFCAKSNNFTTWLIIEWKRRILRKSSKLKRTQPDWFSLFYIFSTFAEIFQVSLWDIVVGRELKGMKNFNKFSIHRIFAHQIVHSQGKHSLRKVSYQICCQIFVCSIILDKNLTVSSF